MRNIRFSNVVTTAFAAGIGGVILFCPSLGLNSPSQIKLICDGINSILTAISVKSKFTQNDIINGIISMEYTIFGIFLMAALRSYTQNVARNIFIPLFIGLSTAILSGYIMKFMGAGIVSLDLVIQEFMYLLLGIFIYLVINRAIQSKFGRGNYSRRR